MSPSGALQDSLICVWGVERQVGRWGRTVCRGGAAWTPPKIKKWGHLFSRGLQQEAKNLLQQFRWGNRGQ